MKFLYFTTLSGNYKEVNVDQAIIINSQITCTRFSNPNITSELHSFCFKDDDRQYSLLITDELFQWINWWIN